MTKMTKMKKKTAEEKHPRYCQAICHKCATGHGGLPWKGHLATHWNDTCEVCGEEKTVTAGRDYEWPSKKDTIGALPVHDVDSGSPWSR